MVGMLYMVKLAIRDGISSLSADSVSCLWGRWVHHWLPKSCIL